MLPRLDDMADDEAGEPGGAVRYPLHFEPDHRQPLDDRVKPGIGLEMVLQPAERELHGARPATMPGTSNGAKP